MDDAMARALDHAIMRVVEEDGSFFKLAHALSCTTKALAAAARLDARFPYVIAYQLAMRWRSKFWLQGIPSAITLFEGNVPPEMAAELNVIVPAFLCVFCVAIALGWLIAVNALAARRASQLDSEIREGVEKLEI